MSGGKFCTKAVLYASDVAIAQRMQSQPCEPVETLFCEVYFEGRINTVKMVSGEGLHYSGAGTLLAKPNKAILSL